VIDRSAEAVPSRQLAQIPLLIRLIDSFFFPSLEYWIFYISVAKLLVDVDGQGSS
jgi:hypothetical protein